ncbi:MAG: hypothetical protein H8D67_29255 [Deltaproteobacteria bacterium]|nr:hypothetical protein [Deltaproteobacteria bacterium]
MPIKRRKKKRRKNKDKYGKLVSKLKQRGLLKEKEILYQPSGEVKMSEVIMDFIEPYREYANTYEAHRKLITLALLAWNAALLPLSYAEEGFHLSVASMLEVDETES